MKRLKCPNCSAVVAGHPENGCVLNTIVQIIRERGWVAEKRLRKIHSTVDTDALWSDLGRVIDGVEEGNYSD